MCNDNVSTMDKLHEDKKITTEEYKNMLDITTTLEEYVYKHIDDISESGADSMLQEKSCLLFRQSKRNLTPMDFAETKQYIDTSVLGVSVCFSNLVDKIHSLLDDRIGGANIYCMDNKKMI